MGAVGREGRGGLNGGCHVEEVEGGCNGSFDDGGGRIWVLLSRLVFQLVI